MNTLSYKGFIGTVCFSEKEGILFGKVIGIEGLVNYEGYSVHELTESFREAVDDYIAYCQEQGIPLHKSYTGTLNIRISPETHSRLVVCARQQGISLNAFISRSLDATVNSVL